MTRPIRLIVVAAVALACGPALWRLADFARTNEYAGHAMFVPIFSALIAWSDRERLRAAAGRGDHRGVLLLAAGAAMLATGYAWPSPVVQSFAVATIAAGAVLWLFGVACLRAAAFPVVFLAMMAPLPRPVVAALTLKFQVFAAAFAAEAVRLVGIPIYQSGVHLELATMNLQVAEVCNGLRFLLAILVMTAAFAQVLLGSWQRKVSLVAAAAVIAIVANAIRVAAIAVGVHYIGPDAASGTVHNWIGKGVWATTLVPLALLTFALARQRKARSRAGEDLTAVPAGKAGVA